jgi:hypothetical protein
LCCLSNHNHIARLAGLKYRERIAGNAESSCVADHDVGSASLITNVLHDDSLLLIDRLLQVKRQCGRQELKPWTNKSVIADASQGTRIPAVLGEGDIGRILLLGGRPEDYLNLGVAAGRENARSGSLGPIRGSSCRCVGTMVTFTIR